MKLNLKVHERNWDDSQGVSSEPVVRNQKLCCRGSVAEGSWRV